MNCESYTISELLTLTSSATICKSSFTHCNADGAIFCNDSNLDFACSTTEFYDCASLERKRGGAMCLYVKTANLHYICAITCYAERYGVTYTQIYSDLNVYFFTAAYCWKNNISSATALHLSPYNTSTIQYVNNSHENVNWGMLDLTAASPTEKTNVLYSQFKNCTSDRLGYWDDSCDDLLILKRNNFIGNTFTTAFAYLLRNRTYFDSDIFYLNRNSTGQLSIYFQKYGSIPGSAYLTGCYTDAPESTVSEEMTCDSSCKFNHTGNPRPKPALNTGMCDAETITGVLRPFHPESILSVCFFSHYSLIV